MRFVHIALLVLLGCKSPPSKETPIAHEFCRLASPQEYRCRVTARFESLEICQYWRVSESYVWQDGKPTTTLDPDYQNGRFTSRCFREEEP